MRPNPLGNPFTLEHYGRDGACNRFEDLIDDYMLNNLEPQIVREIYALAKRVLNGHDINLICCCTPKRCHGDRIKFWIELVVESIQTGICLKELYDKYPKAERSQQLNLF